MQLREQLFEGGRITVDLRAAVQPFQRFDGGDEANFPGLDTGRIENLAIEFAYRLF